MAKRVWRNYLRMKTRNPRFLWQMTLTILGIGVVAGVLVRQTELDPAGLGAMLAPSETADQAINHLESLADAGEWGSLWWELPAVIFSRMARTGPLVLAGLAGVCWLLFLLQGAEVRGQRDPRLWLMLAGIALGGTSVWPTHFFSMWLERRLGLEETIDLVGGVRFFVIGVGLPEEGAKLLCFAPLVPLLLLVRGDLIAMMTAACVGLGFAIVENINYFHHSVGTDAMGRYLTANPMHLTLTGSAGLSFYRAIRDPKGWGPHAVLVFGLVVVAHGLYDAAIVVPALAEISILGSLIFALIAYQFFRELRDLRTVRSEAISLTATFLAGVAIATAATFVYVSSMIGFQAACDSLAGSVLSLSLMVYLFLREMPETMVTV